MTDQELIARLRDAPADGLGTENLCLEAADRIERLQKERDDLGRRLNTARYGQPDFAWAIHEAAMADLRAKMTKAVEALRHTLDKPRSADQTYAALFSEVMWEIRFVLAELEGEE